LVQVKVWLDPVRVDALAGEIMVLAPGVTLLEADDGVPVPTLLVAVTVKV
jgi:hypothetical protein